MSLLTIDCEQGSPEWFQARLGVVTASKFGDILTPTGKPTTGAKPVNYKNQLIAENLTGVIADSYQSDAMRRGIELEPEARESYGFIKDVEPVEIGFCYLDENKAIGCSPDALINEDGLWENKCPLSHNHVAYLLANKLPTIYIPQVQGQLWITDREWCDFMSYHPDMKPLIIRVNRDEKYIKALSEAVVAFSEDVQEKTARLAA